MEKQETAEELFKQLSEYQFDPLLIHGSMSQSDRIESFEKIGQDSNRVLICTSLMARGVDLKNIVLVLNFDCPTFQEDFIHRAGRTGRAGQKGLAVTLMTKEDDKFSRDIIRVLQISNLEVPKWLQELYCQFKEKVGLG